MTTVELGNYSLAFAMLAGCVGIFGSIGSRRLDSPSLLGVARASIHWLTALLTISCAALMVAILRDDFALTYVAGYSERALPLGYKISAFWAGQPGSLLLWAWMLAVMSSIVAIVIRKSPAATQAPTLGILAAACGLFPALMLFFAKANPFYLSGIVPPDGSGMVPLLQDPAMIAHPPLLFLGYAGLTIPFALAFGALIGGRTDAGWIPAARRWTLAAWLFLTAGIILGAEWAYVELGWGGYWKWDAVENASLLPWFTATALIHSLIVQQRRGMLKIWNASLAALSYFLCIFATFVTRSGIIASVHAFEKGDALSPIGWFFLITMIVMILGVVGVMLWRRRLLKSHRPLENLISFESGVLTANVLLTVMMATTLIGTMFPVLSKLVTGESIGVDEKFYNTVILPMFIALFVLMGAGPALQFAKARRGVGRRLAIPGIAALLAGAATAIATAPAWLEMSGMSWVFWKTWEAWKAWVAYWMPCVWMTVSVAVATLVVVGIADDFLRNLAAKLGDRSQDVVVTMGRVLRGNLRRYGGQLTHLGVVMMLLGVAASSLFSIEKKLALRIGESAELGRYTLRLESVDEIRKDNYQALAARVAVSGPDGLQSILGPEIRQYFKFDELNREVAIDTGLREDVYLTFLGAEDGGRLVFIHARVNPMVLWIWIGSIAMAVGSGVCLFSRRRRAAPQVTEADGEVQ
ncbi:hypothetical protein LCGC14_0254090 [marine sediment metagenome]|uniref:Cytochrome c assembly protein domain-containing protein n=1 Tax=marine sediment metagenome TaxID=412755 RepID=A0A0F9X8F8_9ZZZZ|nr:heme lyase CcmF/NrfE family subunit [Phycisphaerae bacterium]